MQNEEVNNINDTQNQDCKVADLLLRGNSYYDKGDMNNAIKTYEEMANKGFYIGNAMLADIYYYDIIDSSKAYNNALVAYEKAEKDSLDPSKLNYKIKEHMACILGELCYNGMGINVDKEKAYTYYYESSKRNNLYAKYSIGYMLYYGDGVLKDEQKALEILTSAAEKGSKDAKELLQNIQKTENI